MPAAYMRAFRLLSRDVRLFLVSASLLGFTIWGGIYTVLLNLYVLRLGYGPDFVGLVNGTAMLAYALFGLPAGALGRRWGTRRAMIYGLILATLGLGLFPLAEFVPAAWRAGWLLVTRVLGSLGISLYGVNGNPFLFDATSPAERSHAFSMQTALWSLAGFAGSLIGGLLPGCFATWLKVTLNHAAAYSYPLLIAAALLVPAVLALWETRPTSIEHGLAHARAGAIPFHLLIPIGLVVLFQTGGQTAVRVFFNVYLDEGLRVSTALIGGLSAVGLLVATGAALLTPLCVSRYGNYRTFILGSAGMILSLMPLALVPHWSAAGLGFMAVNALGSIVTTALMVHSQEMVLPNWRPAMAGAYNMAWGLSAAAIAMGGGYVIISLGYQALFLIGAGLTTAGTVLFFLCFREAGGRLPIPQTYAPRSQHTSQRIEEVDNGFFVDGDSG